MTDAPPDLRPVAGPARGGALRVTKGHGTRNDFVLLADPDGSLELGPDLVRSLADRRSGVGADGVIRLVPSETVREPIAARALAEDPAAVWFMDYRNADGSLAEMCGNGVRVVAAFAREVGAWDGTGELALATRAGVRRVRPVPVAEAPPEAAGEEWFEVDMGRWTLPGGPAAVAAGTDVQVRVPGLDVARPALRVDVGNPHTVVALPDPMVLAGADLARAPEVEPDPPGGTNVELVVPLGEGPDGAGRLIMRVHERGVGETASCGTGACAAALAVRAWAGDDAPGTWWVQVPGGTLRVRVVADRALLAGPAVLSFTADVRPAPAG